MSFPVKSTVLAMSLAATAAFAQPGSGPARGMPPCQAGVACAVQPGNKVMQRGPRMQAMTPEQRQAHMEQRIAQQEKMLQITAAQRPQWNAFVNAHKTMGAARMTDAERQQAATMTPDQRMKWHAQQMEARAQQMNQMAGHVKALRDVLRLSSAHALTSSTKAARWEWARGDWVTGTVVWVGAMVPRLLPRPNPNWRCEAHTKKKPTHQASAYYELTTVG